MCAESGTEELLAEVIKMTKSPFARIGSVTWLVVQVVATVASIVLAFGIDAWWDQRRQVADKNVMLESVNAEMQSDLKWVEAECGT
jgi:hypothetical protein